MKEMKRLLITVALSVVMIAFEKGTADMVGIVSGTALFNYGYIWGALFGSIGMGVMMCCKEKDDEEDEK